ncbi:MAG TPA: cytochrome c [Thermoanaerobaculia bacterium]|nr:cytochrome c [Thermoanaerobaculia bacterium]
MKFLSGLLIGLLLAAAVPLALMATGSIDVAATAPPFPLEQKLAPWTLDRSVAKRAAALQNPVSKDPAALAAGLDHYRENCVVCHGAPGVEMGEAGKGLNPPPPLLDAPAVQSRTDGQMFWIVKNGIRMTGMPAWGPTHKDEEIWHIVAFMRHLPQITGAEKAKLQPPAEEEHHDEAEKPAAPAPAGTPPAAKPTPHVHHHHQ